MNQQKKVHVYVDSEGEFRVWPPVIELDAAKGAGNRDDLEFVNHTGEDIVVTLPAGVVAPAPDVSNVVKNGGKSGRKKAHSNGAGTLRVHNYEVLMAASGKRAKGNSDPSIIIEN
jgi:hypothetical protein